MRLDIEKFLNENGLKIGDKVKLVDNDEVYEIVKDDDYDNLFLKNIKYETVVVNIQFLKFDFEKIEPKKKVGDLTCREMNCVKCPLRCIACHDCSSLTLRKKLEATLKEYPQLEPTRAYFEKELNKEIEEDE